MTMSTKKDYTNTVEVPSIRRIERLELAVTTLIRMLSPSLNPHQRNILSSFISPPDLIIETHGETLYANSLLFEQFTFFKENCQNGTIQLDYDVQTVKLML